MLSEEFIREQEMTYRELVSHLLNKYGAAKYSYFYTSSFKKKHAKVTRTKEGLVCHHIHEDEQMNLGNPKIASHHPFEWQMADSLVYCNYLEHFLLHLAIWNEKKPLRRDAPISNAYRLSYGLPMGGIDYIRESCNTFYHYNHANLAWQDRCFQEIKDNKEDYIRLLARIIQNHIEHFAGSKVHYVFDIGTKVIDAKHGEDIVIRIEDDKDSFLYREFGSNVYSQIVTIHYSDGDVNVDRISVDHGDYRTEVLKIVESMSKDGYGDVVMEIKQGILSLLAL